MSVAMVNSSTVMEFIQDTETFNSCIKECFEMLDVDGNGMLSQRELRDGFHRVFSLEYNLYDAIFKRFDEDQNGLIDPTEFRSLVKELMLAMARGFGDLPILVALEQDSLLMKAAQHELACLEVKRARRKNSKKQKNVFFGVCLCCHKSKTS
jgi:hypothetical protein